MDIKTGDVVRFMHEGVSVSGTVEGCQDNSCKILFYKQQSIDLHKTRLEKITEGGGKRKSRRPKKKSKKSKRKSRRTSK